MNRKGFFDFMLIGIILVVSFFAIIIFSLVWGYIKDGLNQADVIANNTDAQATMDDYDTVNDNFDWVIIMLFLGLIGVQLLILYFLRSHPLFFLFGLIGLFVTVGIAILLSGVMDDIFDNSSILNTEKANFPKSATFVENLPVIMLVIVSLSLVIAYIYKNNGSGF